MEFIQQAEFIANFLEKNPQVEGYIDMAFGKKIIGRGFWKYPRYDIIRGISENRKLFRWYSRSTNFVKYYDLDDALYNKKDNILIHLTDLHLYAVVENLEDLQELIRRIKEIVEDDCKDVNMKQIILSDSAQKIIFVSKNNSEDTIEKFKEYSRKYFGADINIEENGDDYQITIEKTAKDYRESVMQILGFQGTFNEDVDEDTSIMREKHTKQFAYIDPSINNIVKAKNIQELITLMKNIPPSTVVHININNLNNIAGNNNQINQNIAPPDKTQIAREWIAANKPINREYLTDYHKRYLVAHPDGLTRPKLSKLVVEFDFIKKRTNAGMCWVLN